MIEHQCISGFPDVPKKQEKHVDRNSPWENVGQINFPSSLKLSFWMKMCKQSQTPKEVLHSLKMCSSVSSTPWQRSHQDSCRVLRFRRKRWARVFSLPRKSSQAKNLILVGSLVAQIQDGSEGGYEPRRVRSAPLDVNCFLLVASMRVSGLS